MSFALTCALSVCLLAAPPESKQQDALESIEQTRSERHWIDEKTPPPKSPEESRKSFQIEPGLRIELFASEPLVMDPAVIGVDLRVRLLKHRDKAIRSLALKLLGGAVSEDRRQVAEQYGSALSMKATAAEGKKVFERSCAKCHRIGNVGHEVGPDLSDTRNRSREALLYDILDPNRKLEPQYTNYTVLTDDGQVFNGLLVSEEADTVVLRAAEGKLQVIPRATIDQLRGSGTSLMPEGVEKEITVRQMADLLEFLKSSGQK